MVAAAVSSGPDTGGRHVRRPAPRVGPRVVTPPDPPAEVRPRVAAGALFQDLDERVLMVVPSYKGYVDLPGGMVEPGESPRAAAGREVREELGFEPSIGRLLVADWWVDSPDDIGGAKVLFVFEGGPLTPELRRRITVDGSEVTGYRLCAPGTLAGVTVPRLANRIFHAIAARRNGTVRYLEDGCVVDAPVA